MIVENKMAIEDEVAREWTITGIVFLLFGVPIALLDVQTIADYIIWNHMIWLEEFLTHSGLSYFGFWEVWWIAAAVLFEAIFVRVDGYWKWVAVSFGSTVILAGIGDAFRVFSQVQLFNIVENVTILAVISSPYVAVITISVFWLKNRTAINGERWPLFSWKTGAGAMCTWASGKDAARAKLENGLTSSK